MKNLFTLRFTEKDGFHILIFAAFMCLVMSVFVYWSFVNLRHPYWSSYYYTPRLMFGVVYLLFWFFYIISEIKFSLLSKLEKTFWGIFTLAAIPLVPLLYVHTHARNFEDFKNTQTAKSDVCANIFTASMLTICGLIFILFVHSLFSCGCHSVIGRSFWELSGIVVIWIIVFAAGVLELKRVKLPRSKKIISLIFVFLPTVGFLHIGFLFAFGYFLKMEDVSELMIIPLFLLFALTPIVFWIPLAIYMRKYMRDDETFRRYHPKIHID